MIITVSNFLIVNFVSSISSYCYVLDLFAQMYVKKAFACISKLKLFCFISPSYLDTYFKIFLLHIAKNIVFPSFISLLDDNIFTSSRSGFTIYQRSSLTENKLFFSYIKSDSSESCNT